MNSMILKGTQSKPLINKISKNTLIFEELKDAPDQL